MSVYPAWCKASTIAMLIYSLVCISISRTFTEEDLSVYRMRVVDMFRHAYESYLTNAFPFDELKPLSCQGVDTWGSFSLTLIDALDTLAVMKNYTEFRRVVNTLVTTADFNININVSVFETNIRVVGGLISAHLLSQKAGVALEPGWPCSGPLLQLAEAVARRLLPAFQTNTGMPYGTVNLRYGVPPGETPITCTAGVSTFIVEFGTLSRLTGDPVFEKVARKALEALWERRSPVSLVGNHINVQEGKWTAMDAGIGGGIDSYYEYLVKGAILFQDPKLMKMFKEYQRVISKYMQRDDWYFWVSMGTGQITMPVFQSLESFWPGLLTLVGEIEQAIKSLYNYHQIWKQFGFTPEFYDVSHNHVKREGYPLRPELIESVLYLYQATKDPHLLEIGVDILESIQHSARTECGYATIRNVVDHRTEDRMESFFLAETTKYLYLLFDPENFIHNNGSCGEIFTTTGGDCILGAGGYVFNTEAHPIDISAVFCCSAEHKQHELLLQSFQGTMDLHSLLNINERRDFLQIFKQNQKQTKYARILNCSEKQIEILPNKIKTLTLEKHYLNNLPKIPNSFENKKYYSSFEMKIGISQTCEKKTAYFFFGIDPNLKICPVLKLIKIKADAINTHVKASSRSDGYMVKENENVYLSRNHNNAYNLIEKSKETPKTNYQTPSHYNLIPSQLNSASGKSDFPVLNIALNEDSADEDALLIESDEDALLIESDESDFNFDNLTLRNQTFEAKYSENSESTLARELQLNIRNNSIPIFPTLLLNQNLALNNFKESFRDMEEDLAYDILTCPAQPFTSRLNVMGEMFN